VGGIVHAIKNANRVQIESTRMKNVRPVRAPLPN
jgi:hypothetical protein